MDWFDHFFLHLLFLGALIYSILSEAKWRTRAKDAELGRDMILASLDRMSADAEKKALMDDVDRLKEEVQHMKFNHAIQNRKKPIDAVDPKIQFIEPFICQDCKAPLFGRSNPAEPKEDVPKTDVAPVEKSHADLD